MKIRKFLFIIIVVVIYNTPCFCQALIFMGCNLDQYYISFNQCISSKLSFVNENEDEVQYEGTFAGLHYWYVYVRKSSSNRVSEVMAFKRVQELAVCDKLLNSYTEKYGSPYNVYEETLKSGALRGTVCYKVGIHKIKIEVSDIIYENGKHAGWYNLVITYIPNGYIDANSNVRIKNSDI